jgi:UDP-N-acetylmuramoylalanine--D-glutamate ligase
MSGDRIDPEAKRVTVMGLGRFGGGVGVVRWAAASGADVLVTDTASSDQLAEPISQIRDLIDRGRVTLHLGEHNVSDFTTCDLVIASPAVPKPWENRFLRAAHAASIPVTTEIALAVGRLPARTRTIGVTGSAGKSTTSAMIAHTLEAMGESVVFGGNIGGSLLTRAGEISPETWVVLELSSFMLHWLEGWSPAVAVVTNIAPNHLDWHGSMEHYVASKQRLLASQRRGDAAILGANVAEWATRSGVRRYTPDERDRVEGLSIPGRHNQINAALAIHAVLAALSNTEGDADRIRPRALSAVRTFQGLPHRLQLVAQHNGIRFYNDSKSTTPEATHIAVDAFASDPGVGTHRVHLIAGGYDKGSDLSPIGRLGATLAGLYTIGATGADIARAAEGRAIPCETLDAAVRSARHRAQPGDVVLLSPGCASWDQFANYEQRGTMFAQLLGATIRE